MREHVVFTLFAPLSAWGSSSPASSNAAHKPTDPVPTRLALTGMLGAALGWPRERLGVLAAAMRVAVRVDLPAAAQPVPDYHTVRAGQRPKRRERWSRFDELRSVLDGRDGGGAMLSRREYLAEGLWTVAVQVIESGPVSPDDLVEALRRPVYPLFGGRKAFTLGLPPDPEAIAAPDALTALAAYGWPWTRRPGLAPWLADLSRRAMAQRQMLICADVDYEGLDEDGGRWIERRDLPSPVVLEDGRVERRFQVRRERHLFASLAPCS